MIESADERQERLSTESFRDALHIMLTGKRLGPRFPYVMSDGTLTNMPPKYWPKENKWDIPMIRS